MGDLNHQNSQSDGLSLFHNIDRMEESKSQLSHLIERLDRESHLAEVSHLVSGMGGILGSVFEQNYVMQREMKALLDSAKSGLLTNEQMVEAFTIEMKRSGYLTNIVNALKVQIENLFSAIVAHEDADADDDDDGMIDKVTNNVNMLWKSVNSLSTIIDSSPKTLDTNIQKITSELIVPLRSQQESHKSRKLGKTEDSEEEFAEKLGQMKQVLEKRKEMKLNSPVPGKMVGTSSKSFGTNNTGYSNNTSSNSNQSAYGANSSKQGYSNNDKSLSADGSVRSQGNNSTVGQSNKNLSNEGANSTNRMQQPPQQTSAPSSRNINTMENIDSRNGSNRQAVDSPSASVTSATAKNDATPLPGQSTPADYHKGNPSSKQGGLSKPMSGDIGVNYKSSDSNDNASVGSVRSQTSLGNNSISHQSFNDSIASTSIKVGGSRSGDMVSQSSGPLGIQNSLADNRSVLSQVPESSMSLKSGLQQNSLTSASHKSTKGSHGKSTKDDHSSTKMGKHADSHHANDALDSNLQFPFGVPSDVKELMRVLKEKEAVLIKKEADLETEIKKRVKEYIRDHGIGFPKGKGEQDGMLSGPSSQLNTERSPTRMVAGALPKAPSQVNLRRETDDNSTIDSSSFAFGGKTGTMESDNAMGSPTRNTKSAPSGRQSEGSAKHNGSNKFVGNNNSNKSTMDQQRPRSHDGTFLPSSPSSRANHQQSSSGLNPTSTGNRPPFANFVGPIDGVTIKSRLSIDDNDPNKEKIYDIIDIIVNNINYRHGVDNTSKSLDSVDLIKIITPLVPIKQDAACDTTDLINTMKPLKELPIYDHPVDFFVTRTYKITPELESLWVKLQSSENVLGFLLTEFLPFLSPNERMRLNFAALPYPNRLAEEELNKMPGSSSPSRGHIQVRSRDWFTLSDEIVRGMSILNQECVAMMPLISAIESIADDVIQFIKSMRKAGVPYIEDIRALMSHQPENIALLQRSLIDLYRLFGDLQAREISNHVRLYEYRAFFERVQIQGERALKELFRDFPGYESTFTAFTQCQGYVFEIHKRLLECRDRCQRYEVFRLMLLSQQQLSHQLSQASGSSIVENPDAMNRTNQPSLSEALLRGGISSGVQQGSVMNAMVADFIQGQPSDQHRVPEGRQPHESIEAYCHRLEHQLKKYDEDIENLEIEILHMMKEQDKTPPAILFFSLLHDPSFVPNLQQLSLQFHQLKGFVNQTIDMDFLLLKKRLQVCLTVLPSIDKLIDKYGIMHKRWSQQRLNFFAERKLRGSAADNLSTCPLCYHDLMSPSTVVPASVLPENQNPEGSGRGISNQSRTRSKFKALSAAAAANNKQ